MAKMNCEFKTFVIEQGEISFDAHIRSSNDRLAAVQDHLIGKKPEELLARGSLKRWIGVESMQV